MKSQSYLVLLALAAAFLFSTLGCTQTTEPDDQTVATPVFNPAGGTYQAAQSVSISCATSGATIRYTTDGTEPTATSPAYSIPIDITSTTTIKAKGFKDGWTPSATASATYLINSSNTVATPIFDLPDGTYATWQGVSISCATIEATIRYTTDGTEPTSNSLIYDWNLINVYSTKTIKAKGFKDGWTPSATASATYTISIPPTQMINVNGGTFTMGRTTGSGDSDEVPTHEVTLNPFSIGKYEVTQAEYMALMDWNPASWYGVGDIYPLYHTSWYSILLYCNRRSMAEGLTPCYTISGSTDPADWGDLPLSYNSDWESPSCNWSANGYRLPTEAEWEFIARSGTNDPDYVYSGSDEVNAVAWHSLNSGGSTHFGGTKAPNGVGAFDMSGNVGEWCWDWYSGSYYSSSPGNNPTGPDSSQWRVVRGGSFYYDVSYCRVADRGGSVPYSSGNNGGFGFRLCRSIL